MKDCTIKKAVIMCGGWATRFLPVSKATPKELLPLYDTPILQILVNDLIKNGVNQIMFVIRNGKESIAKYFSRDISYENAVGEKEYILNKITNYNLAHFFFTYQNFQRGTGDALLQTKEWVGKDTFFLLNGDEVINHQPSLVEQMLSKYQSVKSSVMGLYKVSDIDVKKYGIVEIQNKENGLIKGIVEKPDIFNAPSNFANIGTYIFKSNIFDYIHMSLDMPITDAINLYTKDNLFYGLEIHGERYDLGSPLGYVLSNLNYILHRDDTKKEATKYIESLGFEYINK